MQDIDGEILCGELNLNRYVRTKSDCAAVSQFTLLANTRKGNKPDFHGAAKPNEAKELYDYFFSKVQELYSAEKVKNGVFQAMMQVGLVNDGPVGVKFRSDNGAILPRSKYRQDLANVKQVTLEIETNPPRKERKPDDATSKDGDTIPNGTTSPLP